MSYRSLFHMTLVTAQVRDVTFCRGRGTKKTKAIRCGVCYYSIVLNVHRVTSMASTDIDTVRKQKKAEYDKQYSLKRKLLLQHPTSTEKELAQKKTNED
jgi:hypothetical protein